MNEVKSNKPRERIIDTSANLFYGEDSHAVGVDRICEVAGVSKRTLYKYFPTKEILIATTIQQLGDMWFDECTHADSDDPTERILHVFRMLEENATRESFFGCVLMNTSIEQRGAKAPVTDVAREFKDKLHEYFVQQARVLGVKASGALAEQLVMLFDGCSAWIVMRHEFPMSTFGAIRTLINDAAK